MNRLEEENHGQAIRYGIGKTFKHSNYYLDWEMYAFEKNYYLGVFFS